MTSSNTSAIIPSNRKRPAVQVHGGQPNWAECTGIEECSTNATGVASVIIPVWLTLTLLLATDKETGGKATACSLSRRLICPSDLRLRHSTRDQ